MAVCPVCGLPEELCMCEEIAREQQKIKISSDRRRYGKEVTIVEGIDVVDINIEEIASTLKKKCAAGGTIKDGKIELQGAHKKKIKKTLEEMGFTVEVR